MAESPYTSIVSHQLLRNTNNNPAQPQRGYQSVHIVSIQDALTPTPSTRRNQYQVTLKRRAVRKRPPPGDETYSYPIPIPIPQTKPVPFPISSKDFESYLQRIDPDYTENTHLFYSEQEEMEGDTSLGMKLTILGGKVIVQNIIALEDGRASPAQLVGLISKGDVLIAVNHSRLVGLMNLELLIERLKPLSAPMDEQGNFQRFVHLQFEIGQGLSYLEKEEQGLLLHTDREKPTTQRIDAAEDLFNLSKFTFVDQWSGIPLYEDTTEEVNTMLQDTVDEENKTLFEQDDIDQPDIALATKENTNTSLDLRAMISSQLADEWEQQRKRYLSGFFTMDNNNISAILRNAMVPSVLIDSHLNTHTHIMMDMDKNQLIKIGNELIRRAQLGYHEIEKELKEMIPIDLFTSKRAAWKSFHHRMKTTCIESKGMDLDLVDYLNDEDLLEFMANTSLWKEQLIILIQSMWLGDPILSEESQVPVRPKLTQGPFPLQTILLGSLAKHSAQEMKTASFPPKDCTSILYTISKQLSVILYPSEGKVAAHSAVLVNIEDNARIVERQLLDDILPCWLRTFHPLTTAHRVDLFSSDRETTTKMISKATGDFDTTSRRGKSTLTSGNTMDSTIKEREIDLNVQHQTCYLVTFYFTRKVLGDCTKATDWEGKEYTGGEEEKISIDFIKKYGAYLNLHRCLVHAQYLAAAEAIISALLEIANYDPDHLEVMKKWNKRNLDNVYEPRMLSAIFSYIKNGNFDVLATVAILIAAFPDLLPCQVRRLLRTGKKQGDLYYEYLTQLMDPLKGIASVKKDRTLVRDWCEMSVSSSRVGSTSNFLKVASKSSDAGKGYYRDLAYLLDTSLKLDYMDVSLSLCMEIIHDTIQHDKLVFASNLRTLASKAINKDLQLENGNKFLNLSPLLKVYQEIQNSNWRHLIDIKNELLFLLNLSRSLVTTSNEKHDNSMKLMMMIAISCPHEALSIISEWDDLNMDEKTGHILFQLLQVSVSSGLDRGLYGDTHWTKTDKNKDHSCQVNRKQSVWNRVLPGIVLMKP